MSKRHFGKINSAPIFPISNKYKVPSKYMTFRQMRIISKLLIENFPSDLTKMVAIDCSELSALDHFRLNQLDLRT